MCPRPPQASGEVVNLLGVCLRVHMTYHISISVAATWGGVLATPSAPPLSGPLGSPSSPSGNLPMATRPSLEVPISGSHAPDQCGREPCGGVEARHTG